MLKLKKNEIFASEVARYLNLTFQGPDHVIHYPASIREVSCNSLCFYEGNDSEVINNIKNDIVIIVRSGITAFLNDNISFITSTDPRRDFFRAVDELFTEDLPHTIHSTASLDKDVVLSPNVHIGKNAVLEGSIRVGCNTVIGNGVSIAGIVHIGNNCTIKDGAVIGSPGFSFFDSGDQSFHIPKFGRILIEDNVWIGANTTIERPTFDSTVIRKRVKLDDLVHVGEESIIAEGCQLAAGVVVANSVDIGKNSFVGINGSVKPHVQIGSGVTIGMGAVVTKDILEAESTHVGCPAKQLKLRQ